MSTQEEQLFRTSDQTPEVILLTGQSGVGKTITAYEITAILKMRAIKHALIDTDELDRIYPSPTNDAKLSENNLRYIWEGFADLGCDKLILCAVLAEAEGGPDWIKRALPEDFEIRMFRLKASHSAVMDRLKKREVGSLLEQHLESSSRAEALIAEKNADIPVIETTDKSVNEVAHEVLLQAGWI